MGDSIDIAKFVDGGEVVERGTVDPKANRSRHISLYFLHRAKRSREEVVQWHAAQGDLGGTRMPSESYCS